MQFAHATSRLLVPLARHVVRIDLALLHDLLVGVLLALDLLLTDLGSLSGLDDARRLVGST